MTAQNDRTRQAYYTKSAPIVQTMIRNLAVENGQYVLEPCGGDGVFVEALLATAKNLHIDVFELDGEAADLLQQKFAHRHDVSLTQLDFLADERVQHMANSGEQYDRIIANPPYGAWQTPEKRKRLKKLFPGLYVKETYTLFLFRCVQLLRVGGRLTFILPDSFLNLHRHAELRRRLLKQCKIERIQLFPSHFFPEVNFGYTGLCILTLEKVAQAEEISSHQIVVETGYRDVEALLRNQAHERYSFLQTHVYEQLDSALFVTDNEAVMTLLNSAACRIGDVADCVTGFYSGDDKRFLRSASAQNKNGRRYQWVFDDQKYVDIKVPLRGLEGSKQFIPIVKGGSKRYYKQNDWFIDWSIDAVSHYRTDKKSRFQNAEFYFKEGVAVPMVSSKALTASLLDSRLFDQSIVGVFPKDSKMIYYLLAFLNSKTANTLIRTINPTANNSANYIKKIPFLTPSDMALTKIERAVKVLLEDAKLDKPLDESLAAEIDLIISELYAIDR